MARLKQVYVPTDQIDELASQLAEVLELDLQFRDGDRWVQYRAGDVSMAVASLEEGGDVAAGAVVPVIEVSDLQETLTRAANAGVVAGEIRDMGDHGQMAFITLAGGARIVVQARAAHS